MTIKNIDCKTLENWLNKGEAILIDVREEAEHQAKNIPNSKLIPLSQISKNNLPNFAGKKLVLHCHSGKRSSMACQKLLNEDANLEIYNLEGGICAYENSAFAIEKSQNNFLPLDQQVQLIIGLTLFISSALTYFISEKFLIIPIFLGLGLSFAGITGFCGLALLVAKCPWNKGSSANKNCKI